MLKAIEAQSPTIKSVEFPETGYYVMREGWNPEDKMMIISAGLDDKKPDHQHGDMLGVQAMANGKAILPNYQVRYSLSDYEFFKNSMVKNVALVDDELQGKQYTSNQGGSGFGKFLELPNPKTITWKTNYAIDVFVGSHDGFKNKGVDYTRQVVFLKDDFWIVKDNFSSDTTHDYKQVWQGHYSLEQAPNLIRATFDNASGLDVYQIKKTDAVNSSGTRGKQWSVITKKNTKAFSFITVLFPYQGFSNRIDEEKEFPMLKDWALNDPSWTISGNEPTSLSKGTKALFFSVLKLELDGIQLSLSEISDVFIQLQDNLLTVQSVGENEISLSFRYKNSKKSTVLKPGDSIEFAIP